MESPRWKLLSEMAALGGCEMEATAMFADRPATVPASAEGERKNSKTLQAEMESDEAMMRKREKIMTEAVEAMVDDMLHRIHMKLNERRIRGIDLFRKINTSGRERCSTEEFCDGLLWMGFDPSDREFHALMDRLDKDRSGGVALKELDRAIKAVERKRSDSEQLALLATKRTKAAAAAMKAEKMAVAEVCDKCGSAFKQEIALCQKCGQKRPDDRRRGRRKLLGYTPMHTSLIEPIGEADDFMLKIVAKMNGRKYRSIDFFRTMDRDASGTVSHQEFRMGLQKIGLTPTKEEFECIVGYLDNDGSGDVSAAEFDKAAKLAVKKAKLQGREGELDTWEGGSRDMSFTSTFDWSQRTVRAAHRQEDSFHLDGSMTERSMRSTRSRPWTSAASGPHGNAMSTLIGCGSVYDNSVHRERLFDAAGSGARPTSTQMPKLPLHKTVYKTAYFDGRFEKEPSVVPHQKMFYMKDRCATATRHKYISNPSGGVKTFHNTPMMQSSVDQAVFNRDMDFSGDTKFDESFMAMYKGSAGMSSWSHHRD